MITLCILMASMMIKQTHVILNGDTSLIATVDDDDANVGDDAVCGTH